MLEYFFMSSKDKNYLPRGCLSQEAFKDNLGGGLQVFQCWGHRRGPPVVVGTLWKNPEDQAQIYEEFCKNKSKPNSKTYIFIIIFHFDFEHTSYSAQRKQQLDRNRLWLDWADLSGGCNNHSTGPPGTDYVPLGIIFQGFGSQYQCIEDDWVKYFMAQSLDGIQILKIKAECYRTYLGPSLRG